MERNIDILNLTPEKLAELQQQERARLAAEEAAKKEKEAAAKKAREAAEKAQRARLSKPVEKILEALQARAPDRTFAARYDDTFGRAFIDEVRKDKKYSRFPQLNLDMELTGSTWNRRTTGRVRVAVGDYGDKTSFPQRKDGTHNYARIAEIAVNTMLTNERQDKARDEMETARRYNEQGVADLRKTLRVRRWDSSFRLEPSSVVEKPVFVEMKISRSMTFSETEKLFKALLALGLVQQEKEGE